LTLAPILEQIKNISSGQSVAWTKSTPASKSVVDDLRQSIQRLAGAPTHGRAVLAFCRRNRGHRSGFARRRTSFRPGRPTGSDGHWATPRLSLTRRWSWSAGTGDGGWCWRRMWSGSAPEYNATSMLLRRSTLSRHCPSCSAMTRLKGAHRAIEMPAGKRSGHGLRNREGLQPAYSRRTRSLLRPAC